MINPFACNCHRCVALTGRTYFGMILCPDCGNKRCPKASNHMHYCTGSNEPDQPGSIYGDYDPHADTTQH